MGNDTDPEGDPLTLTSVQGAVHGTVTLVDGVVQFTPDANYNGPASFTYTLSDGHGGVSSTTVNVTVNPVNDGPDALDDVLSTNEDQPITIAATTLLGNDIDVDGDTLNITSVQSADHGTVALVNGNVVFTPTPNYNGPASFTYTISDGHGGSDTATVTLNVVPVNDTPDAVDDTLTTDEDTPITISPTTLLGNDCRSGWRFPIGGQCAVCRQRQRDLGQRPNCLHPQCQLQRPGQLHLHHQRRPRRH